jgi:hypothetical protein
MSNYISLPNYIQFALFNASRTQPSSTIPSLKITEVQFVKFNPSPQIISRRRSNDKTVDLLTDLAINYPLRSFPYPKSQSKTPTAQNHSIIAVEASPFLTNATSPFAQTYNPTRLFLHPPHHEPECRPTHVLNMHTRHTPHTVRSIGLSALSALSLYVLCVVLSGLLLVGRLQDRDRLGEEAV